MKNTFACFVKDRYLLITLAYGMLNRGQVGKTSQAEARAIATTLLAESPGLLEDVDDADEFLERACATGLLTCQDDVLQWKSAQAQTCLAASRLYWKYLEQRWHDKEQAATWLQHKATLSRWHEPLVMMSHHLEDEAQATRIAGLLAEPAPFLAAQYQKRLQAGWFDTPQFERAFLAETAWPLGDIPFWQEALEDWDSDTRRQAALVLGTARVASAKKPLLGALDDGDDQVRAWSVWALGRLAAVGAAKRLSPLLKDPSRRVQFQTRRALALIQGRETQAHLPPQLSVPRPDTKILVSDDEPEMPDLYKLVLEKKGYTVLSAPGGAQTLELAQREQPDLITTDIRNIHMPGIELVFQLRSETSTRDIPILLASVHTQHWLGFFAGADAFIQLPFGPEKLLALVAELLA